MVNYHAQDTADASQDCFTLFVNVTPNSPECVWAMLGDNGGVCRGERTANEVIAQFSLGINTGNQVMAQFSLGINTGNHVIAQFLLGINTGNHVIA